MDKHLSNFDKRKKAASESQFLYIYLGMSKVGYTS